ncbi:MAG TPA: family 1 glycosylhydrolase [Novosphingobium sp.]|nr:family 1 glycosylhydrolase [Novosphingobium sp.]
MIDRRNMLGMAAAGAVALTTAREANAGAKPHAPAAAGPGARSFPPGFLWGTATAGHQVEGNNVNACNWVLENVKPTLYAQPSGDACNSFALWERDLDLVQAMGLNTCRFSLEWARIEPEQGLFSGAMLDHYKAIIDGCLARGLKPMVTFNHYTAPRWFAARGGWTDAGAADLFTRFCEKAARHLAGGIAMATTLNEPNIMNILQVILPPQVFVVQKEMLAAAARATGGTKFSAANAIDLDDIPLATRYLIAGHKAARAAIKGVRPDLPVGVSLSMFDDQVAPGAKPARRDAAREMLYGPWLEAVRGDDFLGVQNYERVVWGDHGRLPAPAGAVLNFSGSEVYPPSLGNAVRYAHQATGCPIVVSEHGVATADDTVRVGMIKDGLAGLHAAMVDGVPVRGYVHWSLIDNFEWISGYKSKLGLHSFDPVTFARSAKPSAGVLGAIARVNALPAKG